MSGIVAVLQKLESTIQDGDYYQAQQMYKTLYYRYNKKKQYTVITTMLMRGILLMLEHERKEEANDLGDLLIEHFEKSNTNPDEKHIGYILQIFEKMGEIDQFNQNFIRKSIIWSSNEINNDQGSPVLHLQYARAYANQDAVNLAVNHFLRSDNPEEFAQYLLSKKDTELLVESVLQYICLKNLKDANIIYQIYTNESDETPLLQFTGYLLRTLERDAYPLLELLREKYAEYLNVESFGKYLDLIGKLYYGVDKQHSGLGGIMNTLMKSMFQP
eukprot:TRINITY_DN9969_c0_g1_i1.p1 TRINITY_DN9969_c0_g1~~TRINITY_DN9969_c0_g1_i1.p1  ORF type:complete len:280 (-),score=62.45 TRINITY_DN9969_c0_g1_i1:26-844(-)